MELYEHHNINIPKITNRKIRRCSDTKIQK